MALPIRLRLTLIFTVLMAAVLALVGVFIYVRFRTELVHSVDVGLQSRAEQIIDAMPAGGTLTSSGQVIEPDEAFAQVLAPDGTIVDSSTGVRQVPLLDLGRVKSLQETMTFEAQVATDQDLVPSRLLAVRGTEGMVIVVGASLEDQREAINDLTVLAIGGAVAGLALVALVGWVVAGAALRPVELMRQEAAAVARAGHGRRIAVPASRDELARLAETLNDMLDELESALQRERRFVSDTSHELRTPLANLKAEIDLALRRPRDPQGLRDALNSAGQETDRLITLAEELLVLARADQGKLITAKTPVDVAKLVDQVVATFSPRVQDLRVHVVARVPRELVVDLDVSRFRQALVNVLDNAIRHSPPGSSVQVVAHTQPGECIIEVSDSGDGFPEDYLSQAFEPFSRADEGRARPEGGAGLGLAIVQAIVHGHGGSVVAVNRPSGGATVSMRIPR